MYRYSVVYIVVLLFLSCGNKSTDLNISVKNTFSDSVNTLVIYNDNNSKTYLNFKINNAFPLEMENIIDEIEEIASENKEEIHVQAWKYISENTFKTKPYTQEHNWQHEPILYLNSIGGGYCDDRSTVLAGIWNNWYDSTRVIVLEGHVVPEVKVNEKWEMYDPDYKVAYMNKENEVMSVKEIEEKAKIIKNPDSAILTEDPALKVTNPYTEYLYAIYKQKNVKHDATEWHMAYENNFNDTFVLPAKSKLVIQFEEEHIKSLNVELTEESQGTIKNPFVPIEAKGDFDMEIKNNEINVEGNYIFETEDYIAEIDIKEVNKPSQLYYMVNPKIKVRKNINNLMVHSSDSLVIEKKYYQDIKSTHFSYDFYKVEEYYMSHLDLLNDIMKQEEFNLDETFLHLKKYLNEEKYSVKKQNAILNNFKYLIKQKDVLAFLNETKITHPKSSYEFCLYLIHNSQNDAIL